MTTETALIIGGSSGMGLETARQLVKAGQHVTLLGSSAAKLETELLSEGHLEIRFPPLALPSVPLGHHVREFGSLGCVGVQQLVVPFAGDPRDALRCGEVPSASHLDFVERRVDR